jgi:hypothetical protein
VSIDRDSSVEQVPSNVPKTLTSLPPELHHLISSHLTYPDLLSLKLTNNYFAGLISPKLNVKMRVHWVQDRYTQFLPVPKSTKLSFKSDVLFVSNAEVSVILKRRRQHMECVDHDNDFQKVFKNHMLAAEADGSSMPYIRVRGRILPPWSKACLVSGKSVCPKIQELELKKQLYESSFLGKACLNGRWVVSRPWAIWCWLKEIVRSINGSDRRPQQD